MSENATETAVDYGTCAFRSPGHTEPHPAQRYWSGSPTCHACWTWAKLDGPAARFWNDNFSEALSMLDPWDVENFLPAALGNSDDVQQLIRLMAKVRDYAADQIKSAERK